MKHFSVAVFTKPNQTVEELLAPYDHNLKVEPWLAYTKQQAIDEVKIFNENLSDEECWELYLRDYDYYSIDKDGNVYDNWNYDAKWDWWRIGGCFAGTLIKNDELVDSGKVKDVKFPCNHGEYSKALDFWDMCVNNKPARNGEAYKAEYRAPYYIEMYGNRETYARSQAQFSTNAVVTPDGKWHEAGLIGPGIDLVEPEEKAEWDKYYKERFIDAADPEWTVTIVDCYKEY